MDQLTLPVTGRNDPDAQWLDGSGEALRSETAAQPGSREWQVQQARDALEHEDAKVRGIPLGPRDAVTVANHPETPSNEHARIQNAPLPYTSADGGVNGELQIGNCRLQICDCRLKTGDGRLQISD